MKIICKLAAVAAVGLGAVSANATSFTYSYVLQSGNGAITGTFDGTLISSNIISDIVNFSANYQGASLGVNMVNTHSNGSIYVDGGAQISLDGTQNNFAFFDQDYPQTHNYNVYVIDLSALGGSSDAVKGGGGTDYGQRSSFTAQASSVPEPASWAMMIGGFGLMGAAMRRQRKTAVSFS
jgi:hypothetical protein